MELNILKLVLDRAGRITNSQNLSLNQCSSNNRLKVYYEGEYDYIECSFRKPDGWLSDKLSMILDVDEELYNYAYVDIPEDFVTFPMGGRNAILVGNLYLHKGGVVASLGNIRINVNYVDDSLVHTNYSENYMANINSQIGALQNDLNRFKTGDVLVGKAISDRKGNTIDIYYETKADALDKYDDLNKKKLDKSEVQDQTNRLELLEANAINISGILSSIERDNISQSNSISDNASEIDTLKDTKVSIDRFNQEIQIRIEKENELQDQINEISSASNVNDIVGSYTDLLNYKTSGLEEGFKVLVTLDKGHGETSTIYRYTGEGIHNGFEFVGKYASTSYTKTETNELINNVRKDIPNKIVGSDNKLYLYKDSTQIIQDNPVGFKTINGESILGNGNIIYPVDSQFSASSTNPVQNKLINAALENKVSYLDLDNVKTQLDSQIKGKQNQLKAGSNITITEDGTISVTSAIKFEKVESLPTVGSSNIIYLLKTVQSGEEKYTEYIWVDGEWESLGDATLNLSNYYTVSETDKLVADKANQELVDRIAEQVSTNKTDLAGKASQTTVDALSTSLITVSTALNNKAEKSELDKFALKDQIPDVSIKQDKLVSGQNIKTINGVDILGYGDLLLADTEIVDLGQYVKNEDLEKTLEDYAKESELFDLDYTKLKNKPDLEVFTTESEVEEYVSQQIANIPPTDLSNYYTKTEVDTAIQTHVPDLKGYATESYVQTEFANLINGAPDAFNTLKEISDYIASDKEAAAAMLASINQNAGKISMNTQYIDSLETRFDQYNENLAANFAARYTKEEVNSLLDGKLDTTTFKTINGESITGTGNIQLTTNLDNYYTKPQVDNFLSRKSTVKANPGTGTTSLSTITIDGIDYLVRPDMNNYYTKTEVDKAISNVHIDLTGYATQDYVDDQIKEEFSTILNAAPEAYDTFKEIADYIESDLSNAAAMLASINNKADKSEVYTQTEANAKFATKEEIPVLPDMSKYYTKEETVEVIDKVSGLDNYYDKKEVDASLLNKQDILISGSTIKTINGESIIGMGDLDLSLVVANPELDGGEEILESIQIEDTKYSLQGQDMTFSESTSESAERRVLKTITIENEDWIVEKGSDVDANVELSGNEEALESVKINGRVFSVKGEEMTFSETPSENPIPLKTIKLGNESWGIVNEVEPNPELSGTEQVLTGITIHNVNYSLYGNALELSTEQVEGAENLASITINGDRWNIRGGYATEEYVNTKVANLANDVYTKDEVDSIIGNINTILASLVEVE